MPAAGSLAAFSAAISARAVAVSGMAAEAQSAIDDGIRGIARKAAKRAAAMTPRSSGKAGLGEQFQTAEPLRDRGGHVADHWTTEETQTGGGGLAVRVFNNLDKANAPIALLNGGETTLLRILEYGSRAHTIKARPDGIMVFYWPKIGKIVWTKLVHHPGTRPYGMVFAARTEADIDMKLLFDSVRTVIKLTIQGRTGVLTSARNPFRGAA